MMEHFNNTAAWLGLSPWVLALIAGLLLALLWIYHLGGEPDEEEGG